MSRGVAPRPLRSRLILLAAGPIVVAVWAAIAALSPSYRLADPAALERRESAIQQHFAGLLEEASARAALVLSSSVIRANETSGAGGLMARLEGVALLGMDSTFLEWEGLPSEPPAGFLDPDGSAWTVRVDGVRTRLLARAGPDADGRFGLACFVVDSLLTDLEFFDLFPAALLEGLQAEALFADGAIAAGAAIPDEMRALLERGPGPRHAMALRSPSGELLGAVGLHPISTERRRATLLALALACAATLFAVTLLFVFPWPRITTTASGLAVALGTLAAARVLLVWQDAPARILPRNLGAPGLYGSGEAWGLLASPGDLLLTAAALYLACRALRRFTTTLAVARRGSGSALAFAGAIAATAALTALVLSIARNSGAALLDRPAPFQADARFALWVSLCLAALGAAELWGSSVSGVAAWWRKAKTVRPRLPVVISLVALVTLSTALLERESRRLAVLRITHEYAPAILTQSSQREVALSAAMREISESYQIADLLSRPDESLPEFLAYNVWVAGELFHSRLKSAIDVYSPSGRLLSHFGFDLPPLREQVRGSLLTPGDELEIRREMFDVGIADERRLLHVEVPVTRNGEIVALVVGHVLDEADNLAFLPWSQPYVEALGPGHSRDGSGEGSRGPQYVLYDERGNVVLHTVREPPAAATVRNDGSPLRLRIGDEVYLGQSIPDGDRLHLLLIPRRGPVDRLATIIRVSLLGLLLLASLEIASQLSRPGATRRFVLLLRGSFQRKLVAAVLLASTLPLIGLSLFLRAYIEDRSSAELASKTRQYVGAAQQVVEDFSRQSRADEAQRDAPHDSSTESAPLDDILLYWLRGVVGQEIHVYRNALLMASSKRELFSSGLLPERLDGVVQRALVTEGLPALVVMTRLGSTSIPVAYAPIRPPTGAPGELIVAVPLVVEQREIAEEAARVTEMLLIATVVLVGLLAIVAAFLARTVARPVRELVAATSRVAAGSYSTRLEPRTHDEVAELVQGFNAMASALSRQRADLERRRDYIETLLRHATTGVVSLDPDGRVVTLNPAAARLLGADVLRVGERWVDALAAADALRPLARALEESPASRAGLPIDVDLQADDEPRRLRVVRVELRGAAGDSVGTMILLDDVTDLMRSNQLAAWAEMARAIAHEIKNPLTPIQLSAEHLSKLLHDREIAPTPAERACIETIMKQVRALYEIAGEFSAYAKLPDLTLEPTDPATFMRTVIGPYRASNPPQVAIEESYEATAPVEMDRRVLSRAMINLVENALQAMQDGGTLTVAVRAHGPHGSVDLVVADSGPGIDPHVRQRLFEPYFSTKTSGTGLGLAIVRRAVEAHDGEILVESGRARGTTFTIRLPPCSPV